MKKLFFCAAALLAAISFSACSDDDEPNLPATPANIAGTWQIVHSQGWEIYDGKKEPWSDDYPMASEDNYYWTYTFDKGGTCTRTSYEDGDSPYSWARSYSISGNTLTLKDDEYPDEGDIYQIKSLTESQLVLFESGKDSESSWESTETYKRLK